MTIKPVEITSLKNQSAQNKNNQGKPNFTGFNPIISTMDTIERGGYIASFISQDFVGMVAPRIYEGANRNRDKTGQYNWAFARREALRELLSGPSMFIIPLGLFALIKKKVGESTKVPVDRINVLGEQFADFAKNNKDLILNDPKNARRAFYNNVFKNMLEKSTEETISDAGLDGKSALSTNQINDLAEKYTDRYLKIENAKSKGFFKKLTGKSKEGSYEDLLKSLYDDFMLLRKQNLAPSTNLSVAKMSGGSHEAIGGFKSILSSLTSFTNDTMRTVTKELKKSSDINISEFVKSFAHKRAGSRIMANFGIFGAVVLFMTQIPKLYNIGTKKQNPGLIGLDVPENKDQKNVADKKQPTFTGKMNLLEDTAKAITNNSWLKNISDKFEFSGASMTPTQCLTLLFGFCLPPRIINANDKHDRKEILVRDVSSFIAILFAAKALSRGFSDVLAKVSGLALNIKPKDFNKSFFNKTMNYVTAGEGIHVLKTEEILSKYSDIDKFKGGINGFFEFLEENGGNVKKTLLIDKGVSENAEKIVGKSLKDATVDEIKNAFKNISDDKQEALNKIYDVFKNPNNRFVKRAKTLNSAFGFLSTLVLVPSFMIWLARFCEKMTKKDVALEKAQKEDSTPIAKDSTKIKNLMVQQPTMEGFLTN